MRTRIAVAIMSAAALLSSGAALADRGRAGGHGPMELFERLDTDSDGRVTIDEVEAARGAHVEEIDGNADGNIDRAEFIAHAQARAAEMAGERFDRLDADGDGAIAPDTLFAARGGGMGARLFDRLDADGDGAISRAEAEAAVERFAERRGGGGQKWRGHRNQ